MEAPATSSAYDATYANYISDNDSVSYIESYFEHKCPYFLPQWSRVETYVLMTMLSSFSLMGAIGNSMVLYVYSQKRDKQIANHFIIVLAVVDLMTCLFIIPLTMYLEYNRFVVSSDLLCKLYQFLITSIIPFSVLIMVAIAIDRYFCICHPFLRALTIFRAKLITVAMASVSAVLGTIVALSFGIFRLLPKYCEAWLKEKDFDFTYYLNDTHYFLYPEPGTEAEVEVKVGICRPNDLIFNVSLLGYYHKFYTCLFLICLLVIVVLYSLIYRLVISRRARRLQQQNARLLPVNHDSTFSGSPMTELVTVNGESTSRSCCRKYEPPATEENNRSPGNSIKSQGSPPQNALSSHSKSCTWPVDSSRRDSPERRMRRANLKTAAMLFVVTVVFVITYMPAFLMSLLAAHQRILFYLYFANNVANPVIYSFMNKNFRDDLVRIFSKSRA